MEQIVASLGNFGAMGALAGVLLWLHYNSIKAFREELKEERQSAERQHTQILAQVQAYHAIYTQETKILNSTLQELVSTNKQNISLLKIALRIAGVKQSAEKGTAHGMDDETEGSNWPRDT